MSLNIKNKEAHRLAQELAKLRLALRPRRQLIGKTPVLFGSLQRFEPDQIPLD
jgi:hypothetical protein